MSISWVVYLFIANIAIAFVEYTYRVGHYRTFIDALPYIVLPIVVSQWALFHGFGKADNLLVAGALFSLINIGFRLFVTHHLGEVLNWVNWVGVLFLIVSVVLLRIRV